MHHLFKCVILQRNYIWVKHDIYFTSNRMLLLFFKSNYCYCYAHVLTCDLSICWYKLILLKFLITESSMTDKYGHNDMAATGLPPSGYNPHSTRYIIRNHYHISQHQVYYIITNISRLVSSIWDDLCKICSIRFIVYNCSFKFFFCQIYYGT